MKRTFLGALLLCLAGIILPAKAAIVDSGTCGANLTWTLTDDGTLTISGTGEMYDYVSSSPWRDSNIKTVLIEQGVTSIGDYAFEACRILTSVTLPKSVTSIGRSAFLECSSLTSVTIPEGVTSIGRSAFMYCESLVSVTISESVTSIGDYAFYDCYKLTSVTLPESVTSIGDWAFYNCSKLTSITLPESVTSIGDWAFYNCSKLTSITIPEGVTSIGDYAFYNCSSLNTLYYNAIHCDNCSSCGWTSINTLHIGEKVEIIPSSAFEGCSKLTSITIPESVTRIGSDAFVGTALYENESNWSNGAFYVDQCLLEVKNDINGAYSVVEGTRLIADGSFYGYKSLTAITLPESVTSIGERAFYACSGLTEITVKAAAPPVVGEDAFSGVSVPVSVPEEAMLDYVKADGWKDLKLRTENYFTIGLCGSNLCWGLTDNGTLNISGSGEMDDYDAYSSPVPWSSHRNSFLTVQVTQGVTSIGAYAFSGCRNLASVILPESVTSIGDYAFEACRILTSVTLPENLTSIGSGAFYDCSGLTSISLPESVTNIGHYAFSGCSYLTQMAVSATTPPAVGIGVFNGVSRSIPVHVPAESLTAYQNADVWKEFNLQAMASTGLGSVTALEQSIEVCNGEIILNRADRPLVSLYDLGGRLVHQSHDCRIAVPHPGTYILRVGQEAVKVMMR